METALTEKLIVNLSEARSDNDLVSLATPVLEVIMQLKADLIKPSNDLRRTIDELLKQMEQRGETLGQNGQQIQSTKFALAAFADETVLTADFLLRDEWEKYPLQLEYFGEHLAGVKFFERLDGLLKNGDIDIDVIEVYYICMLLGYKGKYKIYLEDQLKIVIEKVADHLRRHGRLRTDELSPHWKVTDQPEPKTEDPSLPQWMKISGSVSFGLVVLIFMALKLSLNSELKAAIDQLLR